MGRPCSLYIAWGVLQIEWGNDGGVDAAVTGAVVVPSVCALRPEPHTDAPPVDAPMFCKS